MRNMSITGLVALLMLTMIVTGCGDKKTESSGESTSQGSGNEIKKVTVEDVSEDIAEAADTMAKFAGQSKDEYISELKSEIDDVETRISELKDNTKALGNQAAEKAKKQLYKLTEMQRQLKANLEETAASSGHAWVELAEGIKMARKDMAAALESAEKEFKSDFAEKKGAQPVSKSNK